MQRSPLPPAACRPDLWPTAAACPAAASDADGRIVPEHRALVFRRPVVGGLVQEFRRLAGHHKAVRKACRYPQSAVCSPPTGSRRPSGRKSANCADIDRDVEYFARNDAHQLALRLPDLVMQSAQYIAAGARMVVLHKTRTGPVASSAKRRSLKLSKKNPRSSPNTLGSMIKYIGNSVVGYLHGDAVASKNRGVQQLQQILAIAVFLQRLAPAVPAARRRCNCGERRFLPDSDFQALAPFDGGDEVRQRRAAIHACRYRAKPCRGPSLRHSARRAPDRSG